MSSKSVKAVRKLERPRPLRLGSEQDKAPIALLSPADGVLHLNDSSDEQVLGELENLHVSVNNGNYNSALLSQIALVCNLLKAKGSGIENSFPDQLDCYFVTLRNACRDERLPPQGRLRLLEVIELRSMGWKTNENLNDYYRRKIQEMENYEYNPLCNSSSVHQMPVVPSASPPLSLQPTEVIKSSGKFGKPAKIPGRNFLKDEVVIRNADSGKVNPGAQNRAVQITGPSEENISHAKVLIEDTIRRNASPVRDVMEEPMSGYSSAAKESSLSQKRSLVHSYSTGDATSLGEYTATILLGKDLLKLSSPKEALIRTAQVVLERHFADKESLSLLMRTPYGQLEEKTLSSRGDLSRELPSWQGLNNQAMQQWNGPLSSPTSSSSDDETFRDEHDGFSSGRRNMAAAPKPLMKSNSIAKNLPVQLGSSNGPYSLGSQQIAGKVLETSSRPADVPVKNQLPKQVSSIPAAQPCTEVPEKLPQGNSKLRSYSRDFLLACARSRLSNLLPPDFPTLDPEVANIIVRKNPTMFDPDGFKQRMMRQGSVSEFVSAVSPSSLTPPQSELSEADENNTA
ncbi:uncharacterized protein LOC135378196 isoform X2 [Ornithodoros turicata]|uniref:Eukaryotic translation initiation factor 4e-binding protein mextli n=1 Tax=Ornithodoros turicata TaxID=34597 RepID=A0A2R5LF20_9ACAR